MKRLFIIATIAIVSLSNAQTAKNNVSKISLHDEVKIPVDIKSYRAKVNLSLQDTRYDDASISLGSMKKELFQKIFAAGIQQTQILEREEEFYMTGCGFTSTSDKDKVTNFLASKSLPGVIPKEIEFQLTYNESQFSDDLFKKI